MLHVSTQKLIIKLCELTAQGDVQWREGSNGAVVFETEGYAVEIAGQPARLRVLNSEGNELERVDAEGLVAAPWPDGEGSFADHVSTMAAQAQRLARGTDHAISRILSSLSAPSAAPSAPVSPEIETHDEHAQSSTVGPESEAAMAAAVADMAKPTAQTPVEEPEDVPPAAPVIDAAPDNSEVVAASPEPAMPPMELDPPVHKPLSAAEHVKRSTEMFGRTRSFAIAGRTHHRPTPEARPVSSLGKITASGLLMTGTPTAAQQSPEAQPVEQPQTAPQPEPIDLSPVPQEAAATAAPRVTPAPASPDAYKPWI